MPTDQRKPVCKSRKRHVAPNVIATSWRRLIKLLRGRDAIVRLYVKQQAGLCAA
jgi:hypothetical protein